MPVVTTLPPAVNTYNTELRAAIDQQFATEIIEVPATPDPGSPAQFVVDAVTAYQNALDGFEVTLELQANTTTAAINNLANNVNTTLTTTYAPLNSPPLTGTPTAPTANVGTSTTQIATTAFVNTSINAAVAAISYAPLTFDAVNSRVGVNKINPTVALDVVGDIVTTGDITAFSTSDDRLKTDIQRIANALEKVCALDGVFHRWNQQAQGLGHPADEVMVGLLASQVEKVLPEIVVTRDNGYKAVRYERVVPLLVEAIKQLNDKIDQLGNK